MKLPNIGDLDWVVHSANKEQPDGRSCEPLRSVLPDLNRHTRSDSADKPGLIDLHNYYAGGLFNR